MRAHALLPLPLLLVCEPSWAQSIASRGGFITGEVSYPSDYIPRDLSVCAEEIATKRNYCTSERQRDGFSYKMLAPQGKYHVFAKTKAMPGVRAYYSEFVTCGLQAQCPSHKPITVEVRPGLTLKSINPQDWYAD